MRDGVYWSRWVVCLCWAVCAPTLFGSEPAEHWSYQPVVRPAVPQVATESAHPIDAFLQRDLSARGLTFSPPAERAEFLRRIKFDLLGLPPAPEEVDRFLADSRPDAEERWIEEFLASPHYGERWGRHWLDVVRYADSSGFNADPLRPFAYQYRDYVIQSFNDDLPYAQFVEEQLAGDEVASDRPAGWIAAGYLRLGPDESNASNILLARQEILNELTSNVGTVFLAQSLGCAQCHDHKFDPLTQVDFYRLQACFAGVIPLQRTAVGTAEQLAEFTQQKRQWEQRIDPLRAELRALEQPVRLKLAGDRRMKFPAIVLASIDAPPEQRTAFQHQLAFFCERQIPISEEQMQAALSPMEQARRKELLSQLAEQSRLQPQPGQWLDVMTATDGEAVPATYNLAGGNYELPMEEVSPGVPAVLSFHGAEAKLVPTPAGHSSGRRTVLARWLTDPRNPLTARVMVNRIWQGHFGRGLAPNTNDFGTQSPPPSHPELLDWLAAEFMEPTVDVGGPFGKSPWRIKRMHKLILQTAAYRQAVDKSEAAGSQKYRTVDPENRWYWCFPARRLEAEAVRDALLAVSGRLNLEMFGPGVQPELPPGYSARESWKTSPEIKARQRRSIYITAKRNLPYPLLSDFDLPDTHESCARRMQTTTGPQALTLLNSRIVLDEAKAFAGRVLREHPLGDAADVVPTAYRIAFSRFPTSWERQSAELFLRRQEDLLDQQPVLHAALPIGGFPKYLSPARGAAVAAFCHVLLNANEFLYLD